MPGILDRWRMLFRPTVVQFSIGPDAPVEVLNMTAKALYNSQDNRIHLIGKFKRCK